MSSRVLINQNSNQSAGSREDQQRGNGAIIEEENQFQEVKLPNLAGKKSINGTSDIFSEKNQKEGDDKTDVASDLS